VLAHHECASVAQAGPGAAQITRFRRNAQATVATQLADHTGRFQCLPWRHGADVP
jgi:hypothetical protein